MKDHSYSILAHKCTKIAAAFTLMLLCLFVTTPAFAQGAYCYSDAWSGENDIYGCGVMEDNYAFPQHQFYVKTTLTKPNGYDIMGESGFVPHFARVDVEFPVDEYIFGDYLAYSEHKEWCPYVEPVDIGSTGATLPIGGGFTYRWYLTLVPGPFPKSGQCQYNINCTGTSGTCSWGNNITTECNKEWLVVTRGYWKDGSKITCLSSKTEAWANSMAGSCGDFDSP